LVARKSRRGKFYGCTSYPKCSYISKKLPDEAEENAIFVRAIVDKAEAYLGQQVTLRYRFYQRVDFNVLDSHLVTPPSTQGFWKEDLPPQRTSNETIDGRRYRVTELVYALFPTQAKAIETTKVLVFHGTDLIGLCHTMPPIGCKVHRGLASVVAERLHYAYTHRPQRQNQGG